MEEEIRMIYQGGEAEVVEKKSRFIAQTSPAASEEDALAFLESVRKKHWNARHHCFACRIGGQNEWVRCSDDGEPGGTAGKPILEALAGAGIHNGIIVVTRYFGGTLLGTGGLVRAYSSAAKAGLAASVILPEIHGVKLEILTSYTGLGKIQYLLAKRGIVPSGTDYTDEAVLHVCVACSQLPSLKDEITEATNGQARLTESGECWFIKMDGRTQEILRPHRLPAPS